MVEKLKKNLIPLAIVITGLLITGAIIYINQKKITKSPEVLSPQQVGEKVISYINENILKGQATATLVNIVEDNGLYKLKTKVGENEFDLYVSKNGKLLFPQVIDLEKKLTQETPKEIPKTEKPDVKLFVMSFCLYGNQAEEIMRPVIELLGNKFNFGLHYIVSKGTNGELLSLHGEQELHQDIREICVLKYQKEKFWDFVERVNKNCTAQNADTCWEKTAEDSGINTQEIKDCEKTESNLLLEQELNLVKEYGVTGSPQLFINGVEYEGERTSEGYKKGICSGFLNPPSECQQVLSSESGSVEGGCK